MRTCSHGTCLTLEVIEKGEEVSWKPLALASFENLSVLVLRLDHGHDTGVRHLRLTTPEVTRRKGVLLRMHELEARCHLAPPQQLVRIHSQVARILSTTLP